MRLGGMTYSKHEELQRSQAIFLRTSRDIEWVKQHGRRLSTPLFNLLACRMSDAPSQVAVIVGKRFGNAVRRNRAKRVFRALARQRYQDLVSGQALLVFPKRDALLQSAASLQRAWEGALDRMQLLRLR